MIVSYVLGANGTVIHIKYVDVDSVDPYTGADRLPPPLGFHRAVCQSGKTEHAAYAEANWKAVVCIISRDRGVTSREALDATSTAPALIRLASMLTQKASIMRSFDDALSFSQFMAELDVNQKRMIKRLHLSRPSYCLSSHPSEWSAWKSLLNPSCIPPFEGLHTLHLCVDMNISYDLDPWSMDSHYDARYLESDLEPFFQLRILPLEEVTVIISDDVPS